MYQTLKGTVRQGRIELMEGSPLPENAVVLVTLLETPPPTKRDWQVVLDEIHARQKARGHVPPTSEMVAAYLEEERSQWDG